MRFAYSKQLSPPGLMLPIVIRNIRSGQSLNAVGKIDTGADMTAIPAELKDHLNLRRRGQRLCKGALDVHYSTISTYFVEYSLDGLRFARIEVVVTARSYVLIGRDLLNGKILTANGPQQFFDIEIP